MIWWKWLRIKSFGKRLELQCGVEYLSPYVYYLRKFDFLWKRMNRWKVARRSRRTDSVSLFFSLVENLEWMRGKVEVLVFFLVFRYFKMKLMQLFGKNTVFNCSQICTPLSRFVAILILQSNFITFLTSVITYFKF